MVGKSSVQEIAVLAIIREISDSNLETGRYGPKFGVSRIIRGVDSTAVSNKRIACYYGTKNSSKITINANFVNKTVKSRFSGDKTAPLAVSFHRVWAAILDDFENFRSRPESETRS